MSAQIQNTLLKTLEEPHAETMLILTGNEFGLLPTIRSRCVLERLGAQPLDKTASALRADGMDAASARFYAALSDGLTERARAYAEPDAAAFREAALTLLETAAFAYSPFEKAAELVTISTAETDAEPEPDEEQKEKTGKKRKRGDAALAARMLDLWASVYRDALLKKTGGTASQNADRPELIARIADGFTTARIQGIIELLARAQARLSGGAGVYVTIDAALTGLFAKES